MTGTRIATVDPTLLLNGYYTLRLSATTTAGATSTSIGIAVDGRMKVGMFTLTFTDLESVVDNLPFQIQRTYDSRDKDVGDFGVGWTLSLRNIRVEKSGKIGAYWIQAFDQTEFFPKFCLTPQKATTVTITFPGGRQYRFGARAENECQYMTAQVSTAVVFENLSYPDSKTIKLIPTDEQSGFVSAPLGPAQLQNGDLDILDMRRFTLTTEDGMKYDLDQDKGVQRITDLVRAALTPSWSG